MATFSQLRNHVATNFSIIPNYIPKHVLSGAAISSNSRFLYISTSYRLYQFDLQAADIAASKTLIGEQQYSGLNFYHQQLAPDGRIYIIPSSDAFELHIIGQPNLKGDSCEFIQNSLTMPCPNTHSIPNYPNFRLGRLDGSSCDTLATAIAEVKQLGDLRVQPNPTTDLLHIAYHTENTTALTVAISDYTGKKL